GKMHVKVVDADGNPVKAKILASIWTDEKEFKHTRDYVCNPDGETDIELPKTLEILRVWARQDGLVPMFANWWPQHDGDEIPEEFIFRLPQGTTIGGVVQDEHDAPIAGVKVEVSLRSKGHNMGGPKKAVRPVRDMWLAEEDSAEI